ncbi:MAG TPA: acetate--CoA ligase family protein [Kofleriaceae bacterium]|jgi:acetyl coenzyme A synthetase (ADP forming)-like protein
MTHAEATEADPAAAAASLSAVFAPRSVAVIGSSRKQGTIGRAILDNLIRDGFKGPIYPIHPVAPELAGRPCARSVLAVGKPIDLAIVAVPAAAVEDVVRDCASAGVRAVVVISAGFAEVGEDGRAAEQRLHDLARASGMRLVGPNCMGVLSTAPDVRLDATFSPAFPPAGNISFATQSGALGLAMIDHARALELGIADFISIGNRADVSTNDLLAYWQHEPHTRVIALYLESFGNPHAFARLAPQVSREKPIVAVKSGRSAAGTRAASSHSASLASLDIGIDALFAQTGVIRVDTLEQLFDVAGLLSSQPSPLGRRVGVVTNAGGPGILLADACAAQGLTLPTLSDETMLALRSFLPSQASVTNPVDMIASAPPDHFEQAIRLVGAEPDIDAVIAIYVPPLVTQPEEVAAAIARAAGSLPATKPIATVFMSSKGTPAVLSRGPRGKIPSYSFPENAAMALAAAVRHQEWCDRPVGAPAELSRKQVDAVRDWAHHVVPHDGWVSFESIATLLEIIGVRVAPSRSCAPDPDVAAAIAGELGFPIVLKANARHVLHKTDVGGVALGLTDESEVLASARAMIDRIGHVEGFTIQKQIPAGVEAIVGLTSDPSLGPLLVAGIGGVAVELYKDVAFRVTPVTDRDVDAMLGDLRGKALLDGFRGSHPVSRDALREVMLRIGALAEVLHEIAELDINPLIVLPDPRGAIAVDARLRMKPRK